FAMELASGNHFDYYVLEVSSFQLDDIVDFQPHIAVITNITPDHLDRYDYSLDKYAAAKFNIVRNLTPADYFIYGADSPELVQRLNRYPNKATPYPFSLHVDNAVIWSDGQLIYLPNQSTLPVAALSLKGKHNLYNAMAAVAVAQILGVPQPNISRALSSFIPPEHRLEPVASINGVLFINDSKATNTDAAWYALDAFTQPIIWIVGGVDKGNDYTPLLPLVQSRVKAIVCLGKDNEKIIQTFAPIAPTIVQTQSAEQAVTAAFNLAASGNVVLLSPACASFDLFNNYQDRGQQFKQAVHHLMQITNTHQPNLTQ
ncbi:MAG TPA: UDP-N-acetylmuramoyl-L-alanine--D-glutamate ligase, partial [Chitinophagales bacterium]|nr:UDP-N-acetylmuramoyl-L-alanine--D-glutamate ligase [Chitinophagales bacterium]